MAIPKAVLEASERADALHREVYRNTGEQPTPTETAPAEQPAVEANSVAPTAQPDDVAAEEARYKVKYDVLMGKYNAEAPVHARQNRELQAQNRELERRLAEALEAQNNKVAEAAGRQVAEVVENFGSEFEGGVRVVASDEIAKRSKVLEEKTEQALQRLSQIELAELRRKIAAEVPNLDQIDNSVGFTEFLDEPDPLSDIPRRYFFQKATQANDAARLIKFFKSYAEGLSPAQNSRSVIPSIESQIAPDSSRSSPTSPEARKFWTSPDIRQHYENRRRGLYSDQEYVRIESDLAAALRENRVAN